MYKRLFLERTQTKYNKTIEEVILESKLLVKKFPEITMYESIYNQVLDIKMQIITNKMIFTELEISNKYNLGAIAVKNFDLENEEFAQKLSDIFGGSIDYHTMPKE